MKLRKSKVQEDSLELIVWSPGRPSGCQVIGQDLSMYHLSIYSYTMSNPCARQPGTEQVSMSICCINGLINESIKRVVRIFTPSHSPVCSPCFQTHLSEYQKHLSSLSWPGLSSKSLPVTDPIYSSQGLLLSSPTSLTAGFLYCLENSCVARRALPESPLQSQLLT